MHKGGYFRTDGSGDFYYILLMILICLSVYARMKLSWRQGLHLIQIISFSKPSPVLALRGQLEFAEWMIGHSEESWGSEEDGDDQTGRRDQESVSSLGFAAMDLKHALKWEKRTAIYLKV